MSEHIVSSFEEQLKILHNTVIKMGALTEAQFSNSVIALGKNDEDLIDKIVGKDDRVDEFEKKIELQVINLIALRHPVANDLREAVSAMKISAELERIGDLSKNIAKRSKVLKNKVPTEIYKTIQNCAEFVQKNLKLSIDAYTNRKSEAALDVWKKDKNIDEFVNTLMEDLVTHMKANKKNLEDDTHLLFISKNIERIGDHATNIAEQVYFLIEGVQIKGQRPKGEDKLQAK
jgi:phosphate transport system protein